jgi:hypothetical protein
MNPRRFLGLAAAAVVAIALALYLGGPRHAAQDAAGGPLLPAIQGQLGAVESVTITKGGDKPTVTLHKLGDRWTVAERGEYPADVPKLRKLLVALQGATIVEAKTADAANYHLIGVDPPGPAAGAGTRITLGRPAGAVGVIVGKSAGRGSYARRDAEAASYLVEPALSVESEPQYWIDPHIADIETAQVRRIEIKPAGGPGYAWNRKDPKADAFELEGVPAGRTALDGKLLPPPAAAFANLSAEDVAPASGIGFNQTSVAILTLANGNVVTITGGIAADKRWITIAAPQDPQLTERTRDRAFNIETYRYDSIFKPLEQLLNKKP